MERAYFQNDRLEMLSFIPRGSRRILEIGCGEGRFLARIEGVAESWGIEPDPVSAQVAASTMTRVLPTTFEAARDSLPANFFDVIVCNDVIEHMDDHEAFFADIQTFLSPNGVLVGSVPNVRYFRNLFDVFVLKDWHYRSSGVLDRTHKRFFTLKSLRRSLEQSEFVVEHLQGINPKLALNFSRGQARYTLFGLALTLSTFGYSKDVTYMQLAFAARLRKGNA